MKYNHGHKQTNTGRTHWKLGHEPWNKGSHIKLKPRTGWDILCVVCGKTKYYQLNEHKKRPRVFCSAECYHSTTIKQIAGYQAIHTWVRRKLGSAKECIYCGSRTRVDWANISQEYKRELTDYMSLCRRHHMAYDWGKMTLVEILSR